MLESAAGGQAGPRGSCLGSGITSGRFSGFIVKQQKTIYTPTLPMNTWILHPLFCGSLPLPGLRSLRAAVLDDDRLHLELALR